MRNIKENLDVDFIGGQRTLTKEDEKNISDFIKANKQKAKSFAKRKINRTPKQKAV